MIAKTTKKPSQLDRIETKLGAMDAFVSTTLPAMFNEFRTMESKLDLLLKGSDFMKEIGEKEEPTFRVGDWVISDSHNTAILKHGVPYKVKGIVPRGLVFDIGDHKDISYGDANFRVATPAEVQKYEEQVKAQEWAKVDELQVGDQCVTSKAEALSILGRCAGAGIPHGDVEILTTCCPVFLWQGDRLGGNMSHDHKSGPMYPVAEWERRLEGTIAKRKAQEQEAKIAKLKFGTRVEYEDDRGWKVAMDKPTPDGLYVIVKEGHARMAWAKASQLTLIDP